MTDALKTTMNHPFFPLAFMAILFFIPHAMIVACPVFFAAQMTLFPDRYRSRGGSLTMAICLFGVLSSALAVVGIGMIIQKYLI